MKKPPTQQGFAQDGYSRPQPLHEGYIRKGGTNSGPAGIKRPPPPAPLRTAKLGANAPTNAGKDK